VNPEINFGNWGKQGYNLAARALFQPKITMVSACKHPRVRVVSRHEDTEFVECLECGEVFDSEEFHDMQIEEDAETEDVSDDS
jgi:hypothetical protein